MTHEALTAADEQYIRQIDAVTMDPIISRVFSMIRLYNELLADQYVDGDTISEIIKELDDGWRSTLGQNALVTGYLEFSDVNDNGVNPDLTKDYYESEEMSFHGVVVKLLDTQEMGYGNLVEETMAKYELKLSFGREAIDEDNDVVIVMGFASVDDVVSFEFDRMMSAERARLWLEHYLPDAIDDIDVALLNPSTEECEMVMRLKDISVDLSVIVGANDELKDITKLALSVYTASLFSFDRHVPYAVEADGEAWAFQESGSVVAVKVEIETLAKVNNIVWQSGTDDKDHIVRPLLDAVFLYPNKDDDPDHLLVPLIAVNHFSSVRHVYFHGQSNEDGIDQQ